ncbi:hypothetical protein ABN034_29885 [Actinopolymorpha sp. B11F2]|uniref:hypothetical protein n=1 Tax=Actinopolymorpha sp. B11F2 TaxID=3160862 RepID=UPI0032E44BAE
MSDLGPEFATQMCERPQDHLAAMAARGSGPWGGLTDRRQVVEQIADQVVVDWRTRSVVVPTADRRNMWVKLVYDWATVALMTEPGRKGRTSARLAPFQYG